MQRSEAEIADCASAEYEESRRSPLPTAIVGCGAVSELFYAPCLSTLRNAHVVALYDPDRTRSEALKRHFPHAEVCESLPQLTAKGPGLAIVSSPPRFHAEQSIALSTAGSAVLCEKPMASNAKDAERMIDAARRAGRPLGVGLFRRYLPVNQTIRSFLQRGAVGKIKDFEIYEGAEFSWPARSASFFSKAASGGGVLSDVGVHVLDLLVWWFGYPTALDYSDDAAGGLEANCTIELFFTDNIRGRVRLSRDTRLPNRTVIRGERGWLECDSGTPKDLAIGFWDSERAVNGEPLARRGPGLRREDARTGSPLHYAFTMQLMNALDAARGDAQIGVTGEDGLMSLLIVDECYRSRKLMAMPWLSEKELASAHEKARG